MLMGTPNPAILCLLLVVWAAESTSSHIDSFSASIDSKTHHKNFIPLVAFKCGYRNKYLNESGDWQSDPSSVATCLQGKLDILKYCKRVYPDKKITNIVEYSHISQISEWCDEETGGKCHKTFYIRPYRCLEGDFTADSLQVPSKCRFGHVSGRDTCEDFRQWRQKAEQQCSSSQDDQSKKSMKLHSFGLLEPCGLSLFRGVEYVCCPKEVEDKYVEAHADDYLDNLGDLDEDEDDDDDDDDDDDEESSSANDSADSDQDPYFSEDSEANEHERYKDAQERLEKKHRNKVTKVITEWSQLFERYNKMKEADPKGADSFKDEMTAKFRKTVASLEEENKEQRRQLEEVHDERVQNALNERKRKATHDYRMALALQVGTHNMKQVLKTLKDYIRAEEKDRAHMLNRYRHLLRSNADGALAFEPMLLHRLRYIDLRINGTLAMLRDFPDLEKQLRPIAEEFWREYRRENTPDISQKELDATSGPADANERLIKLYKNAYDHSVHPKQTASPVIEAVIKENEHKPEHKTKFVNLDDILSDKRSEKKKETDKKSEKVNVVVKDVEFDSDEDQFEEDDEEDKSESKEEVKELVNKLKENELDAESMEVVHKEPILQKKEQIKKLEDDDESEEEDEDDETDDLDDLAEEFGSVIVNKEKLFVRKEVGPSFAKQDQLLVDYFNQPLEQSTTWSTPTTLMVLATVVLCALGIVGVILRHRPSRKGFVEVDVCSPEDSHVDKMQVNGYENPTYSFYDQKP